jgi:3-oxoacyl-[acyl-carrier protein] reductase
VTVSRVIVITGASRGIGAATAQALAAEGTLVVLAARDGAALERVADRVVAAGAEALIVPCDVTDERQVQRLCASATRRTGKIDALVAAAGCAAIAPVADLALADWERVMRASLTGTFLVCREALHSMQAGATIVTVGSVAARQAFPGWSAYCAAKAGLLAFSAALREELRLRAIRVASVLPAATDTELWDGLPGSWSRTSMLTADQVAANIAWVIAQPGGAAIEELMVGHVAGRL